MRLLLVAETSSAHTVKWAQHFARRGYDVSVVSQSADPIAGVRVVVFPGPGDWWRRLPRERWGGGWQRWLAGWPRWRALLRALRPDIVHVHYIPGEARDAFYYRGVRRLVVSTWGSDVVFPPGDPPPPARVRRIRSLLRQAHRLTATTTFLAEHTRRFAPEGKPIAVIPFGVDCERFSPRADAPRSDGLVQLGYIKTLEPKYGPDVLVEAFARIHARHPHTRLLLAGAGSMAAALRARIAQLGLAGVVAMPGRLPLDAVAEEMRRLDLFVMPTVAAEAFGVAAIEASACEVPVVASRAGGVPEAVLDGHTGLLVPPRDRDALAEACIRLIEDPALAGRLGRAGREYVLARYRFEDNASALERLYAELLAHPSR